MPPRHFSLVSILRSCSLPSHLIQWYFSEPIMFFSCSGMPECKLGLNDRVLLEAQGRNAKGKAIDLDDIKFHQYVIQLYLLLCVITYFCIYSLCKNWPNLGVGVGGQIMIFWEM